MASVDVDWTRDFTLETLGTSRDSLFKRKLLNAWVAFHSCAQLSNGPVPPIPPMVLQMLNQASVEACWKLKVNKSTKLVTHAVIKGRANVDLVRTHFPLQPNWWRAFLLTSDPSPERFLSLPLRIRQLRAFFVPSAASDETEPRWSDMEVESVTSEGLEGLERIPTLKRLDLSSCEDITSVHCLSASTSLSDLDLSKSGVTSEGLVGLERIPTLKRLNLSSCAVTSVHCLSASTSLSDLDLWSSGVTSEGLVGLERIPTLKRLNLSSCRAITSVHCLSASTSLADLDLSKSGVTSKGLVGLERISKLTTLNLTGCKAVTAVCCLAASTSLADLDLSSSGVTSDGLAGLEQIPTLTSLNLTWCRGVRNISCLAASTSLINLNLYCVTVEGLEVFLCTPRWTKLLVCPAPTSITLLAPSTAHAVVVQDDALDNDVACEGLQNIPTVNRTGCGDHSDPVVS